MIYIRFIFLNILVFGFLSCTKKVTDSQFVITGKLSTTFLTNGYWNAELATTSQNYDDYQIICSNHIVPQSSLTSKIVHTGQFTLDISTFIGQPFSCNLIEVKTGKRKAYFIIKDTSAQDLNGKTLVTTTFMLSAGGDIGSLNYDFGSGEIEIPAERLKSISNVIKSNPDAGAVKNSVYDPSGTWSVTDIDFARPNGYRSLCDTNDSTCIGPAVGTQYYLKMWSGADTNQLSLVSLLQVWKSESAFNSCNKSIGLPAATKESLHLDFSSNGTADAEFIFPFSYTMNGNSLNVSDGWRQNNFSHSSFTLNSACTVKPVTIANTTYMADVCGPDDVAQYKIDLGGGCTLTDSGKPVKVDPPSGLIPIQGADNIFVSTGTTDFGGQPVTCQYKFAVGYASGANYFLTGLLNDASGSGGFKMSDIDSTAYSLDCLNINQPTEVAKIAHLQCEVDYYKKSGLSTYADNCIRKVTLDLSASTESAALLRDFRSTNILFLDRVNFYSDFEGGAMTTRTESVEDVVSGTSHMQCRFVDIQTFSYKKISDTRLLVISSSQKKSTSLAKAACVAANSGESETFMYYLDKK